MTRSRRSIGTKLLYRLDKLLGDGKPRRIVDMLPELEKLIPLEYALWFFHERTRRTRRSRAKKNADGEGPAPVPEEEGIDRDCGPQRIALARRALVLRAVYLMKSGGYLEGDGGKGIYRVVRLLRHYRGRP